MVPQFMAPLSSPTLAYGHHRTVARNEVSLQPLSADIQGDSKMSAFPVNTIAPSISYAY